MGRHRLPLIVAPHEDVGEAQRDLERRTGLRAPRVRASGDDGGVAEQANLDLVDLRRGHVRRVRVQHVAESRGARDPLPGDVGHHPVGRDQPLQRRAVARHPRRRQFLLDLPQPRDVRRV